MFPVVVGNPEHDIGFRDEGLGSTRSPPLGREFDLFEHFKSGFHGCWSNLSFVENGQRETETEREREGCLKKNQNAPRPSEHPPVRGGGGCQNV